MSSQLLKIKNLEEKKQPKKQTKQNKTKQKLAVKQ